MVKTADTTKIANVYVYAIPKTPNFSSLYPAERQREIESTLNMKVKEEKYYAWKVLEYALDKTFGYKIEDFAFSKTQYGKWETCGVYFSISHSHRVVAVAVSNEPIGVDIELVK
ncbi:MAG: hypothetical protein J6Q58_05220, partial [Clostridia bacterium]|nr:hypothetical protein [Clostridia bacterium]